MQTTRKASYTHIHRRASPGTALTEHELREALENTSLTKAAARKLRNRLSALASRQRTQGQMNYLLDLTKKMQAEIRTLTTMPSITLSSTHKRELEELASAPLEAAESSSKRIKTNHHITNCTNLNVNYEANHLLEPAVFC